MKNTFILFISLFFLYSCQCKHEKAALAPLPQTVQQQNGDFYPARTPIMGWSSWNHFHVDISENLIRGQADAMISSGMHDVGYNYINIDDGFFGGRDTCGILLPHPSRFPSGMKALSEYIHSKGLKAGIYSDAGINTCASYWDKDTIGVGMGLYGHEESDLRLMLKDWNFDFIKIDWCGGVWLGLDEQTRYTEISRIIRKLRPDVVYNICRWTFPGKWALQVADSWRISGDIQNNFESIEKIIDLNADLWKYSGPGHVNDMDMLQVGRGMTYEEDKTHFSMWCMMNSPLLAGNDLRDMTEETVQILTNKDMIAINQDPLVYQARRLIDKGDEEVWAKPLISTMSGKVAVALLNRSEQVSQISFLPDSVGLDATHGYSMFDVWSKKKYERTTQNQQTFDIPPHGVVVLKIEGTSREYNIFQFDDNVVLK